MDYYGYKVLVTKSVLCYFFSCKLCNNYVANRQHHDICYCSTVKDVTYSTLGGLIVNYKKVLDWFLKNDVRSRSRGPTTPDFDRPTVQTNQSR